MRQIGDQPIPELAQPGKPRPQSVRGSSLQGGRSIRPTSCTMFRTGCGPNRLHCHVRRCAKLRGFAQRGRPGRAPRAAGHCPVAAGRRRRRAAETGRRNQPTGCRRTTAAARLGLVRLQVADEMPPWRAIGGFADLLQAFLDLVLAEVPWWPAAQASRTLIGPEGLRDGDQRDFADGLRPDRRDGPTRRCGRVRQRGCSAIDTTAAA